METLVTVCQINYEKPVCGFRCVITIYWKNKWTHVCYNTPNRKRLTKRTIKTLITTKTVEILRGDPAVLLSTDDYPISYKISL